MKQANRARTRIATSVCLVGLFGFSGCGGSKPSKVGAQIPLAIRAPVAIARCYAPQTLSYGFERDGCAEVEHVEEVRPKVWRLHLRLPPVYCVEMRLGESTGDLNLDVQGVGSIEEVRCPPSAYPHTATPDLHVQLRPSKKGPEGEAWVTAIDARHALVVVSANMDRAWIQRGGCSANSKAPSAIDLHPFYSFRSETTIRVGLNALLRTPHALFVDSGGAHGGAPVACAQLGRQ
jgi:hypothetical protein